MRVHLIDGTFELYRAHFSPKPGHTGPDGRDLKASLGVVQSLLGLLADQDEKVTHLAVAFDNPIRSFRNDLFDGYKTDEGVPPELHAQFDEVEKAVRTMGVVAWSMNDFEADDALATAAIRYEAMPGVEQVRILTPDKDLGQVLKGERIVQVDRMRRKVITEASQFKDKGLKPQQVPDFLGLVGDTADGIPGLDGWGEKSTAAVLGMYAHIEDIPHDAATWKVAVRGAAKLAASLAAGRTDALLYRKLATLRDDVPLTESLDDLEFRGVPRSSFLKWCDAMGSESMKTRPSRWA